ncbi:MAG: transglutaminase domain-containing protein, partial [Pseudomonadota bacterium]
MRRYGNCFILMVGLLIVLTFGFADAGGGNGMEKKMQRSLSECRSLVVKMKADLENGRPIGSDLNRLKVLAQDISDIHILLQKEFVETEKKVNGLGAHAADRHQQMKIKYTETIQGFLDAVLQIGDESDADRIVLDALLNLLNEKSPRKKRPIFGSLPYRHMNLPARQPVKTPAMIPAYKGGDGTAGEADLLSIPEAPVTREIALLAESLHWNPVEIYAWVKNNVETQWYWGCMKGAEETLRQKSGNDCDQACLLIALLRSAGYPCRFVQGVIRFFPDMERAKHLTGVADEAGVATFFQKAGIAYSPVIAGGRIANFEIEHIWVETLVPWSNYRGSVVDEHGKIWVALDTAVKVPGFSVTPAADILDELPLTGIRERYLEAARPETPLAFFKSNIQQYLDVKRPPSTYESLVPVRTRISETLMLLPASLQFEQVVITGEYPKLPDALFHKVRFQAISSSEMTFFDKTIEVFHLSGQKIVITYEPETIADQQIVNSFGGLGNTPCYLIRLRPVLVVADERLAVGQDGLPMGEDYTLGVDLSWPGGSTAITNTHIAGNQSVMGIVAQEAIIGEAEGEEPVTAAGLLHRAAMNYIDNWNRSEAELARFYRLAIVHPLPTVVTLGGVVEVTRLLDIPHGVDWRGVYVDADLRVVETAGGYGFTDPARNSHRLFMEMAGLEGSVLEGKVFEDSFQVEAVSTAKLFGIAGRDGVAVRTIDRDNIHTGLPASADDTIAQDITGAVNRGMVVRIPEREMSHEDWSGIGYVTENPETGEAGWMLSGMIAGGMTAWGLDRWPEAYAQILSNAYSEEPNRDPQSGQSIQKIAAADQQHGAVGQVLGRPLQVLVRDREQRPVSGASVTFTAMAGGGRFSNQQAVVTAQTDGNGIASADFILGEVTAANPTFWWEEGYANAQQVGENIVNVALSSGVAVRIPFTAFGFPGSPANIIAEKSDVATLLSFAGHIRGEARDAFGNCIANQMVRFVVQPPVVNSTCSNPNADTRPLLLFEKDDPCLNGGFPLYGDCASQASVLESITDYR